MAIRDLMPWSSSRDVTGGRGGESDPFLALHREMNRLFDDFSRGFGLAPFGRPMFDISPFWRRDIARGTTLVVDVVEKEKQYEITAELPGLNQSDIQVNLSNDVLTIKGEKKEEKEEKKEDYHLSERRYGSFQRSFRVPDDIDADKIQANFKNGVLSITLPKRAEAQKKEQKIDVKTG
jgi:HSP20 family protein